MFTIADNLGTLMTPRKVCIIQVESLTAAAAAKEWKNWESIYAEFTGSPICCMEAFHCCTSPKRERYTYVALINLPDLLAVILTS